ncbi:MAG: alpha/beta hydrolase family protein, partial [Bacillota bacterium]
ERFMGELAQGSTTAPYTMVDAINVTRPFDRPVGCYAGAELRLSAGTSMFWQDERLYFLMSDRGASGVYLSDAHGYVMPVVADLNRSISSLHGGHDKLLYTASTPDQPEELYIRCGETEKALVRLNDALMAEVELGRWEKITYPSDDGQPVDGWILYPVGYEAGKQYPLALIIHGGPHGAYGPSFMFNAHLFASNGYAVLYTNPRGSQTYGQHFACCIDKNWGDRDYADIMAGVDAVLAEGLADPARLFVYGWSYGGYMTSWIVTQTKRFKAACAGAPVVDMNSDYGTADITWSNEHEYGGRPWVEAEHLLKHSPLSYAGQVETPLLLLHGEGDLRCPIIQSEEFYMALKRQGKTVYMVRYPGEYHGPRRHLHRLDRYQRILAWFDHYNNQV